MISPKELRRDVLKDISTNGWHKFGTYLALKQHLLELVVRESDEMRKGLGAVGVQPQEHFPEDVAAAAKEVGDEHSREEKENWDKVERLTAELNALKGAKGKGKGKGAQKGDRKGSHKGGAGGSIGGGGQQLGKGAGEPRPFDGECHICGRATRSGAAR